MTTARTNLGPLTTPFTYPASCTNNVIQCSYCLVAWQAQTCSNNPNNAAGVQDNANCWPSRIKADTITTNVALNGWGIYSPGLSCPVGYNTACSATGTTIGGFQFQFPVSAGETGIGCCPPDYACTYGGNGGAQTCYSIASTGSFPAVQCSGGTSNAFSYYTLGNIATVTTTQISTVSGSGSATAPASTVTETEVDLYNFNTVTMYAPMFQLVHKASDLPSSSASSKGTSSPANTADSTGPSSGASSASGTSGAKSSNGLSSGAIAGIAVGASVVGLALLGAFIFLLLKQRKQKKAIAQYAPPPNLSGNMGMPPDMAAGMVPGMVPGMSPGMSPGPMHDGSYYAGSTPLSMKSGVMHPSPVYEVQGEYPRQELP